MKVKFKHTLRFLRTSTTKPINMLTMRKYLLGALSALLFSISSFAEYKPMLVEGKVWEYKGQRKPEFRQGIFTISSKSREKRNLRTTLQNIQIISHQRILIGRNIHYRILPRRCALCQRDRGKVFGISPEYNLESAEIEFDAEKYEQCLYDFTLSEGDSWEYPSVSYHGNSHRRGHEPYRTLRYSHECKRNRVSCAEIRRSRASSFRRTEVYQKASARPCMARSRI